MFMLRKHALIGMGLKVLCESHWPTFIPTKSAKSDLRSDNWSEFHEEGMLNGGDPYLNSRQRYADSLKESLKRTMIYHEAIFKKQVNELHRLYNIQQNLMSELGWKEREMYTTWMASSMANPVSFQKAPNYVQSEEGCLFGVPFSSLVSPAKMENWDMSKESEGFYSKLKNDQEQRMLNLQLPANEYIHDDLMPGFKTGENTSKKGGVLRVLSNRGDSLYTQHVIDLEDSVERISSEEGKAISSIDFEAPISYIREDHFRTLPALSDPVFSGTRKYPAGLPSLNESFAGHNKTCRDWESVSHDAGTSEGNASGLIDLISMKHQSSSKEAKQPDLNRLPLDGTSFTLHDPLVTSASPQTSSSVFLRGHLDESHHPTATCWRTLSNSHGSSEIFQDNASPRASMESRNKLSNVLSNPHQRSQSGMAQATEQYAGFTGKNWNIDINEPDPMLLEYLHEDPKEFHDSSSKECHSDVSGQANCNSSFPISSTDLWKSTEENVDVSGGNPNSTQLDSSRMDTSIKTPSHKIEDSDVHSLLGIIELMQTAGDAEPTLINSDKSEEDTVSSSQPQADVAVQSATSVPIKDKLAEHSKEFWDVDKCAENDSFSVEDLELVGGKQSFSVKDVELAGGKQILRQSNLSASDDSVTTQLEPHLVVVCLDREDPVAQTDEHACLQEQFTEANKKNEQRQKLMADIDITIQKAAVSLVHFSLENSANSLDWFSNARSQKLADEKPSEQPQCSIDSYESITLKLKETSVEECSTAAWPADEKDTEKTNYGVRWKRGRRLRDFQKDVLPSLVSLSRHEIWEDINLIGGAIQSNESRKKGSRKASAATWCMLTRSRRSRLYYFGQ